MRVPEPSRFNLNGLRHWTGDVTFAKSGSLDTNWKIAMNHQVTLLDRMRCHHVWTLRRGTSTLTCRICDAAPRGFDVETFDGATLIFAQRCSRESGAQVVAASIKRDHLRDGWTEAGAVSSDGCTMVGRQGDAKHCEGDWGSPGRRAGLFCDA